MTHVLIATPTAGGVVKALYATTLLKTVIAVKDAGWGVDFVTFDSAYISRARNYFAHLVLREPRFTHLVMIDSDMSFEGHVICRLLRCDKPVVAAAYSQRRMNMVAFAEAARNPGACTERPHCFGVRIQSPARARGRNPPSEVDRWDVSC
jgi:hypothetical protein